MAIMVTIIHVFNNFLDCFWMLDALLEYSTQGHVPPLFADHKLTIELNSNNVELPERMEGT